LHTAYGGYQVGKYATILADPPWMERGGGKIKRGADRHYPLMHTREIRNLPVSSLALPDAHLYLWVTNNFLPDGLQVMAAWEFRYVTCITWAKDKIGLGQYFRGQTEQCLFGVRGQPGYKLNEDGGRLQGRTLIAAPRGEHSAKPEEMRRMIERVSCGPYLELFAREQARGWDTWGNEVESTVEMEVMNDRIPLIL
jgi:N6-adenosine-specific RNA methylase IME4